MKLIRDTAELATTLATGFQQSGSPAYFGMLGYTDEYVRLTQTDAFGLPLG